MGGGRQQNTATLSISEEAVMTSWATYSTTLIAGS